MPPTVSTRNGIEATWSRCEWVMKMWSMSDSSASERSPTPVPASISTSLSTRNEVVRRWRPPIPPEQPRTRRRTAALFLVERRHAVPIRRWRVLALFRHFLRVHPVEGALRAHALEVEQVDLRRVPLPRPVRLERLAPQPELVLQLLVDGGLRPERLVNGDGFVPALDADPVHLAEHDV